MPNFYEYKAPEYVSSFAPMDLEAIHRGQFAQQKRTDDATTLLGNLTEQLGEEPTADPELYDKVMGNVKKAIDDVYASGHGDLGNVFNKVQNLVSTARSDPFWDRNR
jgi:hypothetical protein